MRRPSVCPGIKLIAGTGEVGDQYGIGGRQVHKGIKPATFIDDVGIEQQERRRDRFKGAAQAFERAQDVEVPIVDAAHSAACRRERIIEF